MRFLALTALLFATAAGGAEFMGKTSRPVSSAGDAALCFSLGQSRDNLRGAFGKGSDFPDVVYAAFEGQGSGDATAGNYLTRGQELYQLVATTEAQCQAAIGPNAGPRSDAEAAAVRRRAQSAKKSTDLYMNLPRIIAAIDGSPNQMEQSLRPRFLDAMYKIADGGNYEAASTLADSASAARSRIRK
ncbi:MAG: hypothetical protein ACHQ51_15190 [Elusimicrobiota bacterium]